MTNDKYYFYLVEDKNDPIIAHKSAGWWPQYTTDEPLQWFVYSPDFEFKEHNICPCGCRLSCTVSWDNEETRRKVEFMAECFYRTNLKPKPKLNRKNYFYISVSELKLKQLLA